MILPDAPWRLTPGLAALIAAVPDARVVGGAVRDTLAGLPVSDIDIATPIPPDAVMAAAEAAGLKVIPTGLQHGTVTVVARDQVFEVTTLRRDVATDGRHATVAFTDDWQADAARRDFTINALYADPVTGIVHDYFRGVEDLKAGRVRFIGDPLARIAEDHLRILRFFRFHDRFAAGDPDADALAACRARANDLMALSRERIADELLKLLAHPDPGATIALMIGNGLFAPVLPEITDAAPLRRVIARESAAGVASDAIRRLAALIGPDESVASAIAARLRLSKAHTQRMVRAATPAAGTPPRALAHWRGIEGAIDALLLNDGDVRALDGWVAPTLPITGGALIAMGVERGPRVAAALAQIERAWVDADFPAGAAFDAIVATIVAAERPGASTV